MEISFCFFSVWRFLNKLGIELPYNSTITLLSIYLEKTITERNTYTLMFVAAFLHKSIEAT